MKARHRSCACLSLMTLVVFTSLCGATGRARLDTRYERWAWDLEAANDDAKLGELTTRLSLGLELAPGLEAEVTSGLASASWSGGHTETGDTAKDLSGMLDTKVRLAYRVGDRLLVRVGINGPTGTTELSPEEIPLAQALASRALAFEGNRLGGGLDLDLGASYAAKIGTAAIGLGAGYLVRGGYTISEGAEEYDPGDQISLAGGIDLSNPAWLWRTNLRAILYQTDQYDAADFYESGDRYEVQTTLLHRWLMTSVWGSLCVVSFGDTREGSGSDLKASKARTLKGEYYADIGLKHTVSDKLKVSPTVGLRILEGTKEGTGKARRIDLGLGAELRMTRTMGVEIKGRYATGQLEQMAPELRNVAKSDLSGLAANASLTLDF